MRLASSTFACLLLLSCDGSVPPVTPSSPTVVDAQPVADEEPVVDVPVTAPEADLVTEAPVVVDEPQSEPSPLPTGPCCRTCRKGKACGDTCVARDRECTVEPGCACDG
jgi:hypothetical protein